MTARMKIRRSAQALSLIILGSWAALGADMIGDFLDIEGFIALVVVASLAPVCTMALYIVSRVEAALVAHAERIDRAIEANSHYLGEQVLTSERFFAIGVRSDRIAQIQAAAIHAPIGETGPFTPFR